ncbi:hypothetical protein RSP816_14190 (plasmid) [Ralstonia solanacearum]|nr:hypothetical protein RSP816_14190 [Ralstonia solanacearum]
MGKADDAEERKGRSEGLSVKRAPGTAPARRIRPRTAQRLARTSRQPRYQETGSRRRQAM